MTAATNATVVVVDAFAAAYGRPPSGLWFAPGRVNLIGEHTDYNDGFVLPFALPQRILCAAAPRPDSIVRVRSRQVPGEEVTADLADLTPGQVGGWAAYALGVAWAMRSGGHHVGGVDLLLDGDVPPGAGLSSSAAVECAVAVALNELGRLGLDRTTLAGLARRAENDFVGAPTGVMDQLASMHGRAGHVLFLDTRTLQIEPLPLELDAHGLALLVVDTRAPHRLVDGAYARRRQSCEEAARILGVPALRDVPLDAVTEAAFRALPDEPRRRARHVVTENARVLAVAKCLRAGADLRDVGSLLTASHASLRDDFEVTVPQVDVAVDAALAAGAHGARMTGGGFGGCIIALVDTDAVQATEAAVRAGFAARRFDEPAAFTATPADGAGRLA